MRHLITGGSGFLGNLIAQRLLDRGEDVTVLDIWEHPDRSQDIKFVNCDVRDRDKLKKALSDIDVVHNNVALVPLTKAGSEFWSVNVLGSQAVAEESLRAGVSSFIHMSSSAIFGLAKVVPILPSTRPAPVEIYGRAKLAGEEIVSKTFENSDTKLVTIRPRTILGEGRLGIFQILFEWIKEGRNVYTIGKGNGPFQFIHALDLMDAYMLALDSDKAGTYNVGTDRFGTLREALENLISFANTDSKVVALPERLSITALSVLDKLNLSPLAPWHYLTYSKPFYFDTEPLTNLGWRAKYSNDEMFRESYEWFVENGNKGDTHTNSSAHRRRVNEQIFSMLKKFS